MIKAYCIYLIMGFVQIWVMVSAVGGWVGSITLAVIISFVGAYIPFPWFFIAHWYFEGTLPWIYMAAWIVGWGALVVGIRRQETRESSHRERCTSEQDTSTVREAFREGEDAYYREDYASAIEKLLPLAEQGHSRAQYRIGMMYASGLGVERDDEEALDWFQLALDKLQMLSDKGDADAQFRLGSMYYNGWALQQDRAEATTWYHKSAEGGDVVSQYNLGLMYLHGKNVQQDRAEAARWFRNAAEKGNADAQQLLGGMYYNGWGLEPDHAEAATWYRRAAEQGHADAQAILGLMFETGTGVKKDYVQAHNWYVRAAALGHEGAGEGRDRVGRISEILSTGDGTKERPFVVASTSEEYLILKHFGKTQSMQMLIDDEKGPMDVMSCTDGSSYHFDISEFYGRFAE